MMIMRKVDDNQDEMMLMMKVDDNHDEMMLMMIVIDDYNEEQRRRHGQWAGFRVSRKPIFKNKERALLTLSSHACSYS